MALTVTEIRVKLTANQTGSNDLGTPRYSPEHEALLQFATGTGANQADLFWADTRTLAASGTENLDLAGVLTDAFGATITSAELVAVLITAAPGNTNNVVVGGAASNTLLMLGDATDKVPVKPGGVFLLAAPNAAGLCTVTAGTGDILLVANSSSGTPVTYTVSLIARSA